jgi:hypothetical protein
MIDWLVVTGKTDVFLQFEIQAYGASLQRHTPF